MLAHAARFQYSRNSGFTLIELMITVAIVAILAAVAYPSYQSHVIKTRRAAAASCLMEMAQYMERSYTTNMTYVGAALPSTQCRTDLSGHYSFSIETVKAAEYNVQAAPVPGSQQAAKDKCGTLTLNQAGTKGRSGTEMGVSQCW